MSVMPSTPLPLAADGPGVRRIGEADLSWALSEGWKDFRDKRGDILVLALLYPLVGALAMVAAFNDRVLPLFFPLVAGISILGPAVASGFYEIARRREAGLESSWIHFLDPLRGRSRLPLALLTAGLAALFVGWMVAAALIYAVTIGRGGPEGALDFIRQVVTTPQGWAMVVIGNLVGLGFAAATLTFTVVSFPMVVDKPVDAMTAVATSIHAVRENPRVLASWGVRVALLLALGCLPAFIGLAVVLPVLGYATWHLYTRLVAR